MKKHPIQFKITSYQKYFKHKLNMELFFFRRWLNNQIENLYSFYLRSNLKNKDFTIISHNCWAGGIYQDLKLEYKTPTVGLFFFPPCYIKFISNLEKYLNTDLKFTIVSKYDKGNELYKKASYPIGQLDDIEVHFLHYSNENTAAEKWNKRKKRINYNNLFFSFSDYERVTLDEIRAFDNLPYKKVFFSAKKINGIKSLVWLSKFKDQRGVGDLYNKRWSYRKKFNVAKWLNS